jgi:hypothetical protein
MPCSTITFRWMGCNIFMRNMLNSYALLNDHLPPDEL